MSDGIVPLVMGTIVLVSSILSIKLGLFLVLLLLKLVSKFIGVFFLSRKFFPQGSMYATLLMCTGLTFGTIVSAFGLTSGIIDQSPYSLLVGVVIASAIIPTFIAQKWFMPSLPEVNS